MIPLRPPPESAGVPSASALMSHLSDGFQCTMTSPRTIRRKRRSLSGDSVKVKDLRDRLGRSARDFERWMFERDVRVRYFKHTKYVRWADVEPQLRPDELRAAHQLAKRAVEPGGSKYWLTGYPELVAQWDARRNVGVEPWEITYGSGKRLWWKCPKGPDHEWQATPCHRTVRGAGCPFCQNKRVSVTNCLATTHPELARQWHPRRNGELKPTDVTAGAKKRVWWTCPKGPDHEWETAVTDRRGGNGCPACSGRQVSATNSLATRLPEVAAQWHQRRNGKKTPHDVTAYSGDYAWWKCPKKPSHVWRAAIGNRTGNEAGCPLCSGHAVSNETRLTAKAPKVASEWHPKKNGSLRPSELSYGSSRVVWWRCNKNPKHEWRTSVQNRTGREATGCPYCSNKKVDPKKSVAALYPEVAAQWDETKNGELTPRDVVPGSSSVRVWWKCPNGPDHEWHQNPRERCLAGSGCPFCRGARVSVTNCLATLAPEIANDWHPSRNGRLTPAHVTCGTDRKAWWRCRNNPRHIWEATVVHRVSRGQGCPTCAGKRPAHLRRSGEGSARVASHG